MTCSNCGKEVGQSKFCPDCGTPVQPAKCSCGADLGDAKFCPECGTKAGAPAASPPAPPTPPTQPVPPAPPSPPPYPGPEAPKKGFSKPLIAAVVVVIIAAAAYLFSDGGFFSGGGVPAVGKPGNYDMIMATKYRNTGFSDKETSGKITITELEAATDNGRITDGHVRFALAPADSRINALTLMKPEDREWVKKSAYDRDMGYLLKLPAVRITIDKDAVAIGVRLPEPHLKAMYDWIDSGHKQLIQIPTTSPGKFKGEITLQVKGSKLIVTAGGKTHTVEGVKSFVGDGVNYYAAGKYIYSK